MFIRLSQRIKQLELYWVPLYWIIHRLKDNIYTNECLESLLQMEMAWVILERLEQSQSCVFLSPKRTDSIFYLLCFSGLGSLAETKKKKFFSSSNQGTLLCQAEGACGKQEVSKKIKSCWQECPWNCSGTHHTALVLGSKVMVRQILKVTCYLWVGMEIRYQKTGSGPFFLSERVSAIDAVVDLGKFVHWWVRGSYPRFD